MTFDEIGSELMLENPLIERADYDRKRRAYRFAVTVQGLRLETGWRNAADVARMVDAHGVRKYASGVLGDAREAARMIETRNLDYFGAWGLVR